MAKRNKYIMKLKVTMTNFISLNTDFDTKSDNCCFENIYSYSDSDIVPVKRRVMQLDAI